MGLKFLISALLLQTSIYTLHFNSSSGSDVSFSAYQGKKMLLVNIATNSPMVDQLSGLQQLQQQFPDSLVVLAFPSNSFGHEERTDIGIQQFCTATYNTTFLIAEKKEVKGTAIQSTYHWLSALAENGAMNGNVVGDFQKYLIDETGNLVASFAGKVLPADSSIMAAVRTNYQ